MRSSLVLVFHSLTSNSDRAAAMAQVERVSPTADNPCKRVSVRWAPQLSTFAPSPPSTYHIQDELKFAVREPALEVAVDRHRPLMNEPGAVGLVKIWATNFKLVGPHRGRNRQARP